MIHYGDITKLSGYDLEPVDLIVGGSPCQDLSVAGKRAGLAGERSGLFLEMIRIIKEMREKTNGLYPTYTLFENVPGLFSSNDGKDFSVVLGEYARLIEPDAPNVPTPEEGWTKSGVILLPNGSLSWRTHDAQFWGVPQRRRRISLIGCLGNQSGWKVLFESKSMSGDTQTSKSKRENITSSIRGCAQKANSFQERNGKPGGEKGILIQEDHVGALSTLNNQMVYGISPYNSNSMKSDNPYSGIYEADTARTLDLNGGNPSCKQGGIAICMQGGGVTSQNSQGNNLSFDKSFTLNSVDRHAVFAEDSIVCDAYQHHGWRENKTINPLTTGNADKVRGDTPLVVSYQTDGIVGALNSSDSKYIGNQYVSQGKCQITNGAVRRLTPLECERLQGYPDYWTNIPNATDSKRFKALGNSIALPYWAWLAERLVNEYGVKTIGSLFDGIGGFPLVFKRAGAKTLWTSEIEPFCEAVTKYHEARGEL